MPRTLMSVVLLTILTALAMFRSAHAQDYTYSLLHAFSGGADGAVPAVRLTLDSAGNIYGSASDGGGSSECGTIFKIDKTGKFSVLYTFTGGADGCNPDGGMVRNGGNLYGVASGGGNGGPGDCGTIFKLDKIGKLTSLYSFTCGADGANPGFGLVRDSIGNFYGVASQGGDLAACKAGGYYAGCGTVFKLDVNGKLWVLYTFEGGADGAFPFGKLVRDAAGDLYGNTEYGGDLNCTLDRSLAGCGTIFKLGSSGLTVLHAFSGAADGSVPSAVTRAGSNLYGTTSFGGDSNCTIGGEAGCGVVFRIDGKAKLSVLHTFTGGTDGAEVSAGVVGALARDQSGSLYGATTSGGDLTCTTGNGYGCGNVFKLDSEGGFAVLYDFTGGPDGTPSFYGTDLVRDRAGSLYGVTYLLGDQSSQGTVFKVTP